MNMINNRNIFFSVIFTAFFISACKHSQENLSLDGFSKYQTFNEYNMKGEGNVVDSPFVYIKSSDNEIIVVPSNDIEARIKYTYHSNGDYWSSNSKYCSKEDVDVCRYFFRDTIVEHEIAKCSGDKKVISNNLFIKTKNTLVNIRLQENELLSDECKFDKILNICRNYPTSRLNLAKVDEFQDVASATEGYLSYKRVDQGDTIIYQCETVKSTLSILYVEKSLAEWGYQPCLEKAISHRNKEKAESDMTRNWAYYDWPGKKRYVDISPKPMDNGVEFRDGHEIHVLNGAKYNIAPKSRFALDLLIDEKANVISVELRSTNGTTAQEQEAIKTAKTFKYKSPAIRNGQAIKCWHWVDIEYK